MDTLLNPAVAAKPALKPEQSIVYIGLVELDHFQMSSVWQYPTFDELLTGGTSRIRPRSPPVKAASLRSSRSCTPGGRRSMHRSPCSIGQWVASGRVPCAGPRTIAPSRCMATSRATARVRLAAGPLSVGSVIRQVRSRSLGRNSDMPARFLLAIAKYQPEGTGRELELSRRKWENLSLRKKHEPRNSGLGKAAKSSRSCMATQFGQHAFNVAVFMAHNYHSETGQAGFNPSVGRPRCVRVLYQAKSVVRLERRACISR